MDALFLLLDEELTNRRFERADIGPGWGGYSVDDQVFWFQFYSLFYERLYIPVNFLTDSDNALQFLTTLGIKNKGSVLRKGNGPFSIMWDTSRFPRTSVGTMVERFAKKRTDVSLRTTAVARQTAILCDDYLVNDQTCEVEPESTLDHKESIEQLRNDVFNPESNDAVSARVLLRLRTCLDRIVDRGDLIARGQRFGYGRNFYYSVFALDSVKRPTKDQRLMQKQFADIASEYPTCGPIS